MRWIRKNLAKTILLLALVVVAGRFLPPGRTATPIPASPNVRDVTKGQSLAAIAESAGARLLVLDLYADWCAPCRQLAPTIDALAGKYGDQAVFYRANVDRNPKLAEALGARGIPFVVFVRDGRPVASLTGVNPPASYEQLIEQWSTRPAPPATGT